MSNKKTAHQKLAETIKPKGVKVYLRTRIGRYLCRNNKFEYGIANAKRYKSVSACMGAIKQMKPDVKLDLQRRGVVLEVRARGLIALPNIQQQSVEVASAQ
jgi:hypothetical protein